LASPTPNPVVLLAPMATMLSGAAASGEAMASTTAKSTRRKTKREVKIID
jgi:hypothetical protein